MISAPLVPGGVADEGAVLGRKRRLLGADNPRAAGWRVARLPGRVYLAMVAAEAMVRGSLIANLSASEWRIIDAFEDGIYELQRLSLTDVRQAGMVVRMQNHRNVSADDWDIAQFDRDHLVYYLKQCATWRRAYDNQPDGT